MIRTKLTYNAIAVIEKRKKKKEFARDPVER